MRGAPSARSSANTTTASPAARRETVTTGFLPCRPRAPSRHTAGAMLGSGAARSPAILLAVSLLALAGGCGPSSTAGSAGELRTHYHARLVGFSVLGAAATPPASAASPDLVAAA